MPVQKALQAYKEEKLNCAQSVLRGFQELKGVAEDAICSAKALGGGRAPEGRCGALHAAMELTTCPTVSGTIVNTFLEKAGSDKCKEIRKLQKLSCAECIQLAAEELLKENGAS